MMLDTMVVYLNFVFTILAILNSIGIVSSQDDIRQGLATDCKWKSIKTYLLF